MVQPAKPPVARNDVIPKLRTDLKALREPAEGKEVFNKLADLTLDFMTKIAKDGQYHPAARVNAMLAIGEVNSPKAAEVLLETLGDRDQIYAVRVAAMTGLVHMAELPACPESALPIPTWHNR